MSIESLTKMTPSSPNFDFGGGGGTPSEINWEDVAGALAEEYEVYNHACAKTASEYAWCFILKKNSRLRSFKRKMLVDLGRYWVEKKLDHPKTAYLTRMIDVACIDAMAGSGKKPSWKVYVATFGCTKNDWYNNHRRMYRLHVYPFLQEYESILHRAMRRMHYDD